MSPERSSNDPAQSKRRDPNDEERVSIPLSFEEAMQGLLKVDPSTLSGKDAKLAHIARATREELATPGYRAAIVQEAREADASWDEINAALETPRYFPRIKGVG
jgi:hypothetical protein